MKKVILGLLALLAIGAGAYFLGGSANNKKAETVATEKKAKSDEVLTVGILQFISHPSLDQIHEGVIEGLKDKGYVEGKNLKIEYLNGQGDQSKLNSMSQQLLDKKADVLVGIATPAAQALANATSDIPIIMGAISDPVKADLVKDLKHPGSNITGVSNQTPVNQQLKLAKKIFPDAKKIGMIYSSTEDNAVSQIDKAEKDAKAEGYEVKRYAIASSNDLAQTTQVMSEEVDFIYVPQDNVIASAFQTLMAEADKAKKPVFVSVDNMVKEGGVATVGQNQTELGVETGKMTADVLDGASKPADTPVNVIDYGETIVNEEKAKELGIKIPEDVLKDAQIIGKDDK